MKNYQFLLMVIITGLLMGYGVAIVEDRLEMPENALAAPIEHVYTCTTDAECEVEEQERINEEYAVYLDILEGLQI